MIQILIIAAMMVAAALGAIGQVALKQVSGLQWYLMPFSLYTWLFIASYCIALVINILVYKAGAKVALAYPVIACSYAFAALLAWWLLGERIGGWTIAGICCIMLGVGMIGIGG